MNKFRPVQLVTVYQNDNKEYYLESSEISNGKVGQASPLTEEVLSDIVKYFTSIRQDEDTIKGNIPDNVIFCDWSVENKVLAWYNKPMTRGMYFTSDLHIPSGTANQPTVLYIVRNKDMYVFVVKTSKVGLKSPLFIAPYHNCCTSGSVCLGSASVRKPAKPTFMNIMEYWEKKFWNSEFSHLNGDDKLCKVNINLYWKNAIKKKLAFDSSILIASKYKTFEAALKSIYKNA